MIDKNYMILTYFLFLHFLTKVFTLGTQDDVRGKLGTKQERLKTLHETSYFYIFT